MLPDSILFLFTYLGSSPATGFVRMDLDSLGGLMKFMGLCKFSLWRSDCRPEPKFLFHSPSICLSRKNYPLKWCCLWVSCTSTLLVFRHCVFGMLSDIVKIFLFCWVPKPNDCSDYCVRFLHLVAFYLKWRSSPVFSIIVVFLLTQIFKQE